MRTIVEITTCGVGEAGFEPAASASQTQRANQAALLPVALSAICRRQKSPYPTWAYSFQLKIRFEPGTSCSQSRRANQAALRPATSSRHRATLLRRVSHLVADRAPRRAQRRARALLLRTLFGPTGRCGDPHSMKVLATASYYRSDRGGPWRISGSLTHSTRPGRRLNERWRHVMKTPTTSRHPVRAGAFVTC